MTQTELSVNTEHCEEMNMIDTNPGYVVIPLEGGIPFYAVLAPDGSILSEHKRLAAALSKARRRNRQAIWA